MDFLSSVHPTTARWPIHRKPGSVSRSVSALYLHGSGQQRARVIRSQRSGGHIEPVRERRSLPDDDAFFSGPTHDPLSCGNPRFPLFLGYYLSPECGVRMIGVGCPEPNSLRLHWPARNPRGIQERRIGGLARSGFRERVASRVCMYVCVCKTCRRNAIHFCPFRHPFWLAERDNCVKSP